MPRSPDHTLSRVLGELARGEGDRLTLDQALEALGDRSSGGVILVLTLVSICMPPGLSAVPATPVAMVGVQMLFGRQEPWVPQFVRSRSLDRRRAGRVFDKVRPTLQRVERYLRPRWPRLLRPAHLRLVGLGCVALSVPMIIPIPFAHSTAGLGLIAFAAGLLVGDGLALLAGWGMALVCAGVLAGEALLGHHLSAHVF